MSDKKPRILLVGSIGVIGGIMSAALAKIDHGCTIEHQDNPAVERIKRPEKYHSDQGMQQRERRLNCRKKHHKKPRRRK